MPLSSAQLTLLIGPTIAVPAPPTLMESLQSIEVSHSDEGRSAFQITFSVGRGGTAGTLDFPAMATPLLKTFNRVIIVVTMNAVPRVVMDGIITHQQLAASDQPGRSRLTITGEDVSVMMDLQEQSVEHPAQDETVIALKLIGTYAQFGLIPVVIPPPTLDQPIPTERVPVQQGTDLQYLQAMAERYGYVFYVAPGPVPGTNTAYWGPPKRQDLPQRALSVDMGPMSNAQHVDFSYDALAPSLVVGQVQDRDLNTTIPVATFASTRFPLSTQPAWLVNQPNVRTLQLRDSGLTLTQALARAQGITDKSSDAVSADGELDTMRYGDLLQARGIVGLRGAGYSYDGLYYVKRVVHSISRERWTQRFSLTREGVGSTTPAVVP